MNNLLSFCGLVDARISVSEKDLPVQSKCIHSEIIVCFSVQLTAEQKSLTRYYQKLAKIKKAT